MCKTWATKTLHPPLITAWVNRAAYNDRVDLALLPLPFVGVVSFILGSLVGSFLNVVIYRVPAGVSIVFPRSRCPKCGHTLGALELVPILSWAVQGAKCRNCKAPIAVRYPAVEALTALLFLGATLLHPVFPDLIFIWAFIGLLIGLSFIDIDTQTLPNSLNFGGLILGLLGAKFAGFPQAFPQAVDGALMGAGLIALFSGVGGLLYNRKDGPREGPIGLHVIHFAGMVGAIGGALGTVGGVWLGALGIVAGALNWMINARSGKVWALHDGITLGIAALAPLLAWAIGGGSVGLESLRGVLISTGAVALAGMVYWWIRHPSDKVDPEEESTSDTGYVTVMGYGDVVLAGFLGAWLGIANLLVGVGVAVFAGAIIGIIIKRITGESRIPFGPYLAIGGLVAFFWGQAIIQWYLGYIGVG